MKTLARTTQLLELSALALLATAPLGGCSLLVDAEQTQCEADADCISRGEAFADRVCEQKLCVIKSAASPEPLECPAPTSNGLSTVKYSFATLLPTSAASGEPEPLRVHACQQLDLDCQSPVGGPYEVPAGAVYDFSLPQGFSGFFQINSDSTLPALYFVPRPVVTDTIAWSPTVLPKAVLDQLAAAAGVSLDANSGVILASVRDCDGAPVEGVSVTASEPGALRFYMVNSLPVVSATATSAQGAVGFANVPATTVALEGVARSGKALPSVSVRVRSGALSLVELRP